MISRRSRAGAILGGLSAAAVAWGWFEAGWVRLRTLRVGVPGLEPELDGLRIAHLSDLHLGLPSRGRVAVERGVEWAAGLGGDLVCVTGDLISRPAAERDLRALLARLPRCYAVLGNHEVEHSRDPFSRGAGLGDLAPARLLVDEAETVELRGRTVQLVGVDPRSYRRRQARPERLVDARADLRILLCHFPNVLDRLPEGAFHLVLAGHMHDGQISLPTPRGKLRLAHLGVRYTTGTYRRGGTTMHVSPGLGTTFVPFRFYARPEATQLILESVH
jgi:predicted MPP superfamily phosphohydrolase